MAVIARANVFAIKNSDPMITDFWKAIPLSHRPRKRFGQRATAAWLFFDSVGVRAV